MSRKSEFKENSANKSLNESVKRQKMNENINFSKSSLTDFDEDKDLSNSVTVYEDDNDLSYFNKSSINRLLNSSVGKRSPLATLNKDTNQPGPSGLQQQPTKSIAKLDESFFRRLQPKEESPDPFEKICDEILLQIFSYLPKKALNRVALVNRRFSRVMLDETLWIRIDLGNKPIRKGALSKILCRGFIVLRLAMARVDSPIFESDFIAEGFESALQYLDLSMASIDRKSLAQLIGTCRSLKKLSLEAVIVDSAVCREIAKNKDLEVLNLAMCDGIDRDGMVALMTNLPKLLALNISWTHLSSACVLIVMANLTPSIMRLNIAGCRKTLIDKHLKLLSERCPNIVELDVSDCTLLTSATILYVSCFFKLEYLSLSRCYNITASSYLTLHSLHSLIYLDVFGLLSESGLKSMEKAFKNIGINKFVHSSVARPTVTPRRTSVWGLRTRD